MVCFRSTYIKVLIPQLVSISLLIAIAHPSSGITDICDDTDNTTSNRFMISLSPFSPPLLSNLLSKKSIAILITGGMAAWLCSQVDDDEMIARALDNDSFFLEGGLDLGDAYGNGATLAFGTLGLWLVGHLGGHPVIEDAGGDLTRTLLLSSVIVWSLKLGINRQRPGGGNYSFPSGHTAAAFSAAPILYHYFGWKVGIPSYSFATLAGLGRMEDRKHYLSDILFGAAIGMAVGDAVIKRDKHVPLIENLIIDPRSISLSKRF